MTPGISVHHMVKDPPIDRLAALDEYLRPYVNEIVIVADRCSDDDMDTMRSWGTDSVPVTVIPAEFTNFADTRNIGLKEHKYEWTLHLDPDELPSAAMLSHIVWATREGMEQFQYAKGWLYWTINFWGGRLGEEKEYHWHTRLWKTASGVYYRPVHELIRLDGRDETETRGTSALPRAPKAAYLIHSKPAQAIPSSDALYAQLGEVSK